MSTALNLFPFHDPHVRLLTVLLDRHVERISRRMCNLPYVTMVVTDNLQLLSILMLADLVPGSKTCLDIGYNFVG
ncbi:Hypothetical protein glysoja_048206 [Glycine soja]|uniref:Uncharacterized protein n=1 Tax=Glycine soja TaxID=3848 RepID=A0A0B2SEY6_GLYSO|nr:Hypothetical protein glysoja_048206 [Glycine soja]